MKYICSRSTSTIAICHHGKKKKLPYTVGLVSAFALEQSTLGAHAKHTFPPWDVGGRRFNRFILKGKLVVAVICGVGMTNAAMTTQLLISTFNPTYVFFSGIAGSLNSNNHVGDVMINRRWMDIGSTKYAQSHTPYNNFIDVTPDYPMPMLRVENRVVSLTWPSLDGIPDPNPPSTSPLITSQMAIPMAVETLMSPNAAYLNTVPTQFFFEPDSYLVAVATSAIRDGIALEPIATRVPDVKFGDVGLSSGTFLDNAVWRTDIVNQFLPTYILESCDMETAAFAHTAISNSKPFLAIRALSDLAGGGSDTVTEEFFEVAAQNSVIVFVSIVSRLEV